MYILLSSNNSILIYPYTLYELRKDNPGTSFPESIPDERLADWSVFPVVPIEPPQYNPATHKLVEELPTQTDGIWTQNWSVVALTEQELEILCEAAAAEARAQRNQLLAQCDWTQLPDAPVDSKAWATYRQALRDITTQSGWPLQVTWPTPP